MDSLRQLSQREGEKVSQGNIPLFHSEFLSSIRKHGRVQELEMVTAYTLKNEGPIGLIKQALGLGLKMLMRGKLKLLPHSIRATDQVKNIFKQAEEKG